jgi:hypothetical protein
MMRFVAIGLACVFTGMAGIAVAADEFGRLFFSPAQRAQLDAVRAKRDRRLPMTETADTTESSLPSVPQGPDVVTYNGVVRRSDGKSTVWINGKPMTERTQGSDVSVLGVRRDGAVSVAVPQADRSASLRVGQSMEVMSGTIEEPYARRATLDRLPAKAAPTAPGAASTSTPPPAAVVAPTTAAKRAARRDTKESDHDSGAAPPVERGTVK